MEEAAAAAAAMASSLPEDVLLEILFRLKDVTVALFRCATACIRWHGLVAEPAFLRRCWPDQDVSSSILGFFTQQFSRVPTPCFTPMPRSAILPRLSSLGSFIPAAPTGVFDGAAALVSRHGLLLVRLDTTATRGYPNPIVLDLAVCNLLTGTCHMLPALKFGSVFDECQWNGYAILTGADCRSNDEPELPSDSSFFHVVIISSYRSNDMKFTIHMFSSEEGRWTVRTNCFDGIVQPSKHGSSSRAVVRRGTANWLISQYDALRFGVLNLNMRTGDISLRKIPLQLGRNCYLNGHPHTFLTLAVNGALSLLWMQKTGTQIEIWEQQEEQPKKDGGSEWVCARTIELKQLAKKGNEVGQLCILGQTCGTLLIHHTSHGVYTADLETGMTQEVVDWPRWEDIYPRETVPLEVDWPTVFASRLVTRKQKMENQVTYPPGWELMYLRGNKRRKTKSCMGIFEKRPI